MLIFVPAAALADETEPTPAPDSSHSPLPTVTSSYALLSGIDTTLGTWDKLFSCNVSSYTLILGETQKTVTITPKKGDDSQTVTINGKQISRITVSVDNGKHKHITIKVKQAGKKTRVYYVKIAREKSSNNDMARFSVTAGTMDSAFDPAVLEYNVVLDFYTPSIYVKAARADSHATLRIDGHKTTSRKYSMTPGAERTVTITVRSQINVTKTYLIHIKREASTFTDRGEALIDFAKHFIGTKYVHGGKSPSGFDCSGFVYYCLNGVGYKTRYRTSRVWPKTLFETIPTLDKMLPGDILCFKGHVAIYMGNNEMIDSAHSVNGVSIKSCVSPYWRENFICGKRVFIQENQPE
jgi:cell wall-associated NlpC family hydrolase